jgi:hypothetical protein
VRDSDRAWKRYLDRALSVTSQRAAQAAPCAPVVAGESRQAPAKSRGFPPIRLVQCVSDRLHVQGDIYFTIRLNNLKLIKCSLFRMAALGAAEDRGLLRTSRETAACPQWGGRPRPRASPWTRSPIMPLTERGAQLPVPLNDRPDNPAIDA